jgi:type I pantothenate kinase
MEQRIAENLSPYRTFSRAEWAALREDTPMTLTPEEVTRLRSLHDRLDMKEVEEIYLPLSRLLSMYVAATQRLFVAQQRFLGTCKRCWRAGQTCRRSILLRRTDSCFRIPSWNAKA